MKAASVILPVLFAQGLGGAPPAMAKQGAALTPSDKQAVIAAIARKLTELYPVAKIAERTRKGLLAHHRAGRYAEVVSPSVFAHQVTTDLEALSHDKHLDLLYDPALSRRIVRKRKSPADEDVVAASEAELLRWENFGFRSLRILDGHVGYLDLRTFFATRYAGRAALTAMEFLSSCRAVIIDLRQNGGGWDDMVMLLASHFVDGKEPKTVAVRYSTLTKEYNVSKLSAFVPGRKMTRVPVYLLVSRSTASAAEAFSSILRQFNKNVLLVGEKTAGAENPVEFVSLPSGFVLKIPCWKRVQSVADFRWEGKGLRPDLPVPEERALAAAHRHALETLRKTVRDEQAQKKLQWALEGLQVARRPRKVDRRILERYVGTYGKTRIHLRKEGLAYRHRQRPERMLLSITDDYFAIEGYDDRRVRFIVEGNRVVGLRRIFSDGYQTTAPKLTLSSPPSR